jgi:hypothetical protein
MSYRSTANVVAPYALVAMILLSTCQSGCVAGFVMGGDPAETDVLGPEDTSLPEDTDTAVDTSTDTAVDTAQDTAVDTDTDVPPAGITFLSSPGPLDMDAWEGTAYPETIRGEATHVSWTCNHPLVYVRGLGTTLHGSDEFEVVMHSWDLARDGGAMGSLIVVDCQITSDQNDVAFSVNAWRVTP